MDAIKRFDLGLVQRSEAGKAIRGRLRWLYPTKKAGL